jgi:heat-inducible transcriptional repressor
VQYPSLSRSSVRHVELVYLTATRALLVLISDTGRVEQRVVDLPGPIGEEVLAELRVRLLAAIIGRRLSEVPEILETFTDALPSGDRPLSAAIVATILEMVIERPEERVVVGGAAHLARFGETFHLQVQPLLEALEEQVVLLRLLGEATSSEQVTVRIGRENPEGLESTSIVTAGYSRGDEVMARLGVVGPTHMDYPSSMASVRAVAQYLSRILSEQ